MPLDSSTPWDIQLLPLPHAGAGTDRSSEQAGGDSGGDGSNDQADENDKAEKDDQADKDEQEENDQADENDQAEKEQVATDWNKLDQLAGATGVLTAAWGFGAAAVGTAMAFGAVGAVPVLAAAGLAAAGAAAIFGGVSACINWASARAESQKE